MRFWTFLALTVACAFVAPSRANAELALPLPGVTPGVVASTRADEVCSRSYARSHRPPRGSAWRTLVGEVRLEYHIRYGTYRQYRIDHLIPLELGGAGDDAHNIWPQPVAESILKDRVEDALHREVCDGRLPLAQAQREIARDWRHTSVGDPERLPHSYFEDQPER